MTAKTKPRTRLSPEARKNHLLDVSKEIILGEGLQGFSMEALARGADVSSPLVYNYFASRVDALQSLLRREFQAYAEKLTQEVSGAKSFEEVVRIFIVSNFDHFAPGNIIPILESQPEIATGIKDIGEMHGRNVAQYLVNQTASTYKLTKSQAELVVSMSSGASVAAAQYASRSPVDREKATAAALAYILAGLERLASGDG